MSKINSLNEALNRLENLMKRANLDDQELVNYIKQLHSEKQNTMQKLNKIRQESSKSTTTSSMHSKLKDALYE